MSERDHESNNLPYSRRNTGDLAFAAFMVLFSVLLLSQLGAQTQWVKGLSWGKQPGFWPAVSLLGMTVCSLIYLVGAWREPARRYRESGMLAEVGLWVRSVEYALWLMGYVFVTPLAGYLPSTVAFCLLLSLRVGYRSRRMLGGAVLFGIVVVVLFKSLLRVSIPGGAVYEVFPEAIRNFLIVNF